MISLHECVRESECVGSKHMQCLYILLISVCICGLHLIIRKTRIHLHFVWFDGHLYEEEKGDSESCLSQNPPGDKVRNVTLEKD